MNGNRSRTTDLAISAALFLVAAAVYLNTLSNGFVYDDIVQVVRNHWITDPKYLPEIFSSGVWGFAGMKSAYYRPMMHLVYMASWHAFGPGPWGFHLTSLVLHAVVTVLVYFTLLRVITSTGGAGRRNAMTAAALGAGIFAVHTVHTEAVGWVAGLPDLLYTLFLLGSLLAYAASSGGGARGRTYIACSAGLFLLGALSKEPALMLPALIVAYDLTVRERFGAQVDAVKRYAPYALVAVAYVGLRTAALGSFAPNAGHRDIGTAGLFLNAVPLLGSYLRMLVLPYGLSGFHAFTPAAGFADKAFLFGALGLGAFAAAVYALGRRDRAAYFAGALVVIPLLPGLYIPALGDSPLAERYLYLPSAGLSLFVALIVSRAGLMSVTVARALTAGGLAVILAMGVATVDRNRVWKDDLSYWSDAVSKTGGAAVPLHSLGMALMDAGSDDEGADALRRSIEADPSRPGPYVALGNYHNAKGELDRAKDLYEKTLELDPDNPNALNNLGVVRARKGDIEGAAQMFEAAVRADPDYLDAYGNLRKAYSKLGRTEDAARVESYVKETVREGAAGYKKSMRVGGD